MEPETNPLGPKKTFLIIATVVGCIGILWPKVFHPMLAGGQAGHSHIDPMLPPILRDRAPGEWGCWGTFLIFVFLSFFPFVFILSFGQDAVV